MTSTARRGLGLLLFAAALLAAVYSFARIHGIESIETAAEILRVSGAPLSRDRCVPINGSHVKCLPNAFLIGASKAGTTSLFHTLLQHPDVTAVERGRRAARAVGSPENKRHFEIHRFDRPSYAYSIPLIELLSEYASCPPIPADRQDRTVVLHYTPHYLYAPSVPFEMRDLLSRVRDSVRFIVILRHPTRRAESSYWFKASRLFHEEDRGSLADFNRSIDFEIRDRYAPSKCTVSPPQLSRIGVRVCASRQNFDSCMARVRRGPDAGAETVDRAAWLAAWRTCFGSRFRSPKLGLRHVDKGIYVDQLARWFTNFGRHQFHILTLEGLVADPQREVDSLLAFLGVGAPTDFGAGPLSAGRAAAADTEPIALRWRLKTSNSRTVPLSSEIASKLDSFYAPYNAALARMLPELRPY